jgi:hypothetical protein
MMHPDAIEEMDYAANARADYMWEAYGAEEARYAKAEEAEFFWDSERECDVRDIPTVREARYNDFVVRCVENFLCAFSAFNDDYCPF